MEAAADQPTNSRLQHTWNLEPLAADRRMSRPASGRPAKVSVTIDLEDPYRQLQMNIEQHHMSVRMPKPIGLDTAHEREAVAPKTFRTVVVIPKFPTQWPLCADQLLPSAPPLSPLSGTNTASAPPMSPQYGTKQSIEPRNDERDSSNSVSSRISNEETKALGSQSGRPSRSGQRDERPHKHPHPTPQAVTRREPASGSRPPVYQHSWGQSTEQEEKDILIETSLEQMCVFNENLKKHHSEMVICIISDTLYEANARTLMKGKNFSIFGMEKSTSDATLVIHEQFVSRIRQQLAISCSKYVAMEIHKRLIRILKKLHEKLTIAYPSHIPVVFIGSQNVFFRCSDDPQAVAHIGFNDNIHEVFAALF